MIKKKNEDDKRIIKVSVDRVKLTLQRYKNKKSFMAELISYLGSIVTLLITIVTAQYSDFWFLSKEALEGVFITLFVVMVFVFIFRLIYVIFAKRTVYDEDSFVDNLEYNKEIKTIEEINNGRKFWIGFLMIIVFLMVIALYVFLGFIFKWAIFFDIMGTIFLLFGIIAYFINWFDIFNFFFRKVKKKEENKPNNIK